MALSARPARLFQSLWAFSALALLVNFAAIAVNRMALDPGARSALNTGLFLDFAITIPAAYYFMLVRPGLRSPLTLALVTALSLLRGAALATQAKPARALLAAGVEIALVAALVIGLRSGLRSGSPGAHSLDRIGQALEGILPSPLLARIAASEIAVFYYALGFGRSGLDATAGPAGTRAFTIHRQSGIAALAGLLAALSLVEAAGVHLVIRRFSGTAAWALTGISVYGAIWLVAMARSFAACPLTVNAQGVILRFGLLWTLRVPATAIAAVERVSINPPRRAAPGYIRFAALTDPALLLRMNTPLAAEGPYGIRKRVTLAGVAPDDAAGFAAALREFGHG